MRLSLLLLLGTAAAEPLFRGLHVIRQEQEEAAAAEAAAAEALEANATAADAAATEANATEAAGNATAAGGDTAANETKAIAEVGHEALFLQPDGSLVLNVSVGTPPQHVLVALSLDEIPSDLRLTSLAVPDAPSVNATELVARAEAAEGDGGDAGPQVNNVPSFDNPSSEVVGAAGQAASGEEAAPEEAGPQVNNVPSFDNPSSSVVDASEAAADAGDATAAPAEGNAPDDTPPGNPDAKNPSSEVVEASEEAADATGHVLAAREDLFDPAASTTFQTNNETYGTELNNGTIGADTVTVGTVSLTDQPFSASRDDPANPSAADERRLALGPGRPPLPRPAGRQRVPRRHPVLPRTRRPLARARDGPLRRPRPGRRPAPPERGRTHPGRPQPRPLRGRDDVSARAQGPLGAGIHVPRPGHQADHGERDVCRQQHVQRG
jgi:hypothetical protein